jgi:hypothetical protein
MKMSLDPHDVEHAPFLFVIVSAALLLYRRN